ncbi:hypothetical protein GS399_13285 [Pedobacter sp. HMF7647]|uniref:Uncharacterized protein n=1 Tax=Hufsiella arboris TaxID=2695275 RepID=A0A7K1YBZ9_9SPHI|nr:DUF6580 family putative transport protein [Hufsiella arboris]MXV51950.1 hypothetical protein [Hufsiella arboris]
MSISKLNIRNSLLILIILAAGALRLVDLGKFSTWANFTPVGAIAMFGGTYFQNKWKAYVFPLITLMATDWIISYAYFGKVEFFYSGFLFVYLAFAAMVYVGSLIKKVNAIEVISASIICVVIHWLISDIQPWLFEAMYPKTFAGYIQCLVAAIPFERNLMLGNLVFGGLMYGGFELAKTKVHSLQLA